MRTNYFKTGLFLSLICLFSSSVTSAQTKGDYRTRSNGEWNSISVWERWNGVSWQVPTAIEGYPDSSEGNISILHLIDVEYPVALNQLVIQSSGSIHIGPDGALIITDGPGTDLIVNGSIINQGELLISGTASFNATAVYRHAQNAGLLPENSTWHANALLEFSNKGESRPAPLKKSVVLGRVVVKNNTTASITSEKSGLPVVTVTISDGPNADLIVEDGSTLSFAASVDTVYLAAGSSAEIQGTLDNQSNIHLGAVNTLLKVTGTGVLENEGNFKGATYAKLHFAKSALYDHKQDGGEVPNANWDPESDCRISGLKKVYPEGMNQVFGNVEFNCALGAEIRLPGSLDCAGNLSFTNSTGYKFVINSTEKHQTIFVGGNLQLNSGNIYFTNARGKGSLNIGGDYIQEAAVNVFMKSDSGDATLFVVNDLNKKGGTLFFRSRDTAATNGSAVISVRRNFNHTGGVINFSAISGSGILEIGGDYVNSVGQLTETGEGTGEVIFNGSGEQMLIAGGNAVNTINFTVPERSFLQFATPAASLVSGGTFTVMPGATLGIKHPFGISLPANNNGHIRTLKRIYYDSVHYIFNGSTIQTPGDGFYESYPASLTVDNPYYLNIQEPAKVKGDVKILQGQIYTSGAELLVGGNWINEGKKTLSVMTDVEFNGDTQQIISGALPTTFSKLKLNNPKGLVLLQDIVITSELELTNGILNLTDHHLTLGVNALPVTGAPFNSQKMVATSGKGELRKEAVKAVQASYTFPVGDTIGIDQFTPVTLLFAGGQYDGYVSVQVINNKHPHNPSNDNYLNRYWTINQSGFVDFNATVITSFDSSDVTGKSSLLQMGKYNDDNDSIPWSTSGIAPSGNLLTFNNVTSFSDFTGLGITIVLPPAKRTMQNGIYAVNGSDLQERNRIFNNQSPGIKIYPNPVQGRQISVIMFNIKPGRYQMVITNNAGQRLYSNTIEHKGGNITATATLLSVQPAGIYRVQLVNNEERYLANYLQQ